MLTIPQGQAGVGVMDCPDDYIVIDGVRLCGARFNDGTVTNNASVNAVVTGTYIYLLINCCIFPLIINFFTMFI